MEIAPEAWFLAPEDVILYKLSLCRQGGETSQKLKIDIVKMLAVGGDCLDLAPIEKWAAQIGVVDL